MDNHSGETNLKLQQLQSDVRTKMALINASPVTRSAVSYTHLDVYKRQLFLEPDNGRFGPTIDDILPPTVLVCPLWLCTVLTLYRVWLSNVFLWLLGLFVQLAWFSTVITSSQCLLLSFWACLYTANDCPPCLTSTVLHCTAIFTRGLCGTGPPSQTVEKVGEFLSLIHI